MFLKFNCFFGYFVYNNNVVEKSLALHGLQKWIDVHCYRMEFVMNLIYLDNSATTKPSPSAVRSVMKGFEECFGNPSSGHFVGVSAAKELAAAREMVAKAMKVTSNTVFFTSGGTLADNIAVFGGARAGVGMHVVTSSVEHPAILNSVRTLEDNGFRVSYVKPDHEGVITAGAVAKELRGETSLVSIMHVNNETGAVMPIREIAEEIKKKCPRAFFHTDAVQSFGKIPFEPLKMGVDMASVSSHKVHGPKGAGALYVKQGVSLNPFLRGGGQERGLVSGTENLPAIMGFAAACGELSDIDITEVTELSSLFKKEILGIEGVTINSPENASPYILNVSFGEIPSEVILNALSTEGICVSAGSACAASKGGKSYVLKEMGVKYTDSAIRISFSRTNTKDEILAAAAALKRIIPMLSSAVKGYRRDS